MSGKEIGVHTTPKERWHFKMWSCCQCKMYDLEDEQGGCENVLVFIDYAKSFNYVGHSLLSKTMTDIGVPPHITGIVSALYTDQKGAVRLNGQYSKSFQSEMV